MPGIDKKYKDLYNRFITPCGTSNENCDLLPKIALVWSSGDDDTNSFENWKAKYVCPILFEVSKKHRKTSKYSECSQTPVTSLRCYILKMTYTRDSWHMKAVPMQIQQTILKIG
jgi:hypothetical protein